jgi:hypothetical protein
VTEEGQGKLLTLTRVLVALVLVALFVFAIFKLAESERLWRYFEKVHNCRIIDARGAWATYFCDDGLTFSRRR